MGMGNAVQSDHALRPDISPAMTGKRKHAIASATLINVKTPPIGARTNQGQTDAQLLRPTEQDETQQAGSS